MADRDAALPTRQAPAPVSLPPAMTRFILHWGDLGTQWGVNRSVAQIHALLYLSEEPLNAEQIAETLGLARSNVSTSIRELLNWQLIHRVPLMGDRRDHYAAETDIWEMVTRIARGRKAREVDPAEAALKAATAEADADKAVSPVARERLHAMLDFVTTMSRWHDEMIGLPKSTLLTFIRMGSKVTRFLSRSKQ
ncbi:MAG TPA: MarR family transcriptional regulator [Sphingomicrobium sp.]